MDQPGSSQKPSVNPMTIQNFELVITLKPMKQQLKQVDFSLRVICRVVVIILIKRRLRSSLAILFYRLSSSRSLGMFLRPAGATFQIKKTQSQSYILLVHERGMQTNPNPNLHSLYFYIPPESVHLRAVFALKVYTKVYTFLHSSLSFVLGSISFLLQLIPHLPPFLSCSYSHSASPFYLYLVNSLQILHFRPKVHFS